MFLVNESLNIKARIFSDCIFTLLLFQQITFNMVVTKMEIDPIAFQIGKNRCHNACFSNGHLLL